MIQDRFWKDLSVEKYCRVLINLDHGYAESFKFKFMQNSEDRSRLRSNLSDTCGFLAVQHDSGIQNTQPFFKIHDSTTIKRAVPDILMTCGLIFTSSLSHRCDIRMYNKRQK